MHLIGCASSAEAYGLNTAKFRHGQHRNLSTLKMGSCAASEHGGLCYGINGI